MRRGPIDPPLEPGEPSDPAEALADRFLFRPARAPRPPVAEPDPPADAWLRCLRHARLSARQWRHG